MNRNHERQTVILFCQDSAEMAVPRVTMHKIGIDVHSVEVRATPHRAESRTQRLWTGETSRVEFKPDDLEISLLETLVAKATHFNRHHLCQLPRQIANMHARAAVDVGRILVSQKQDLHQRLGRYSGNCVKRRIAGTGVGYQCLYTYFARISSTGTSTA